MKTASVKFSQSTNQYVQHVSSPAFTGLKAKIRSGILLGTIILGGTTTAAKAADSVTKIPQKTLRQCNAVVSIEKYFNDVMLPATTSEGNFNKDVKKFNSTIQKGKRNCIEVILRDSFVPESQGNNKRIEALIRRINSHYNESKDYLTAFLTR